MNTIKQVTRYVEAPDGRKIAVSRMPWKGMRDFLRKVAVLVTLVIANSGAKRTEAAEGQDAPAPRSLFAVILEQLPEIITGSDELVMLVCTQSTQLSLEEFDALDSLTALKIIEEALSINCDDETKKSCSAIAHHLAGLMPERAKTA